MLISGDDKFAEPAELKLTVPRKPPATYTPLESTARDFAKSLPAAPTLLTHWKLPLRSIFSAKTSLLPLETRFEFPTPGSKSALPLNSPIAYNPEPFTLSDDSRTWSLIVAPVSCLTHWNPPSEFSFSKNESKAPILVKFVVPIPASKSTVD